MVSYKKVMCPYCHATHSISVAVGTSGLVNVDDVWISVNDRLPEYYDMYIVAWVKPIMDMIPEIIHFYEMLKFDEDGWNFDDTALDESCTVIAWKPLPKPYIGG